MCFTAVKIIKKKQQKKKQASKQTVDMEQHLRTYRTPCSRGQGYFVLRYRRYSSPGWRPELPLCPPTPLCSSEWCQLNSITPILLPPPVTGKARSLWKTHSLQTAMYTSPSAPLQSKPQSSAVPTAVGNALSTPTGVMASASAGLLRLHHTAYRAPATRLNSLSGLP